MDYIITTNGELKHYGVLGMKWGIRRSRKFAKKAAKARTKEKRDKYQSKSDKIAARHERLSGGKKVVDRVNSISTGKAIAQSLVFNTYGALKYNAVRAKGVGRGKAAVEAAIYGFGQYATSGIMGIVEPRLNSNTRKSLDRGVDRVVSEVADNIRKEIKR